MWQSLLRTVQIAIALIVLAGLALAIGVAVGALAREEAIPIGLDVAAVVGLCAAAGIVLQLLFGVGRRADHEP